jgi:hypothetical protein
MTDLPENRPGSSGRRVHRVHWVPGADRLRAVCHCGAEREFDEPTELWDWLLGHPAGHEVTHREPQPRPVGAPVLAST